MEAPNTRSTRRARRHAAHRHTYKQRGGARWVPEFASEDDERFKAWKEEIEGNPELNDLFPSLLTFNRNDPALTDDTMKKEHLKTYLNCLAHQDKLFRSALNIIKKKVCENIPALVGVELTTDLIVKHAAEINALNSLKEYLRDVEKYVRFDYVLPTGNHKLLQTLGQTTGMPLSTILLFPAKVENIFIRALSELIVSIVENQKVIEDASGSGPIKEILATQYESYSQALSYTLASTPLWDGYYLVQKITDITRDIHIPRLSVSAVENSFWYKFVTELVKNMNTSEAELFLKRGVDDVSCNREIVSTPYERLAADLCRYAVLNTENMDILKLIASSDISDCADIDLSGERKKIPEQLYEDIYVADSSVTFKKLLSNVGRDKLEFLLHLEVGIKECLTRRASERSTRPESSE